MTFMTAANKNELVRLYDERGRFYHDMSHITTLLALFETHRTEFTDPDVIEAAIWYHDCIYNTRNNDNEHQSAKLAVAHLGALCVTEVDKKRLFVIRDMIEATATHTLPQFTELGVQADAAMFLDMDLSILGVDEAQFDAYEDAVRKEYAWVDNQAWRKGRADVLARFAARPQIYFSNLFREVYESKARENIARSLGRLRSAT